MSVLNYKFSGDQERRIGHFSSIVKLALADNVITEGEEKLLKKLADKFIISEEMYNNIIKNPDKYSVKGLHNYDDRIEHLYDLAKMIYADGSVSKEEASVLIKICVGLGFPIKNTEKIADEAIHLILKNNNLEDFTDAIKQVNKQ
ncbi:TerB family tellurite resistance protein [Lutibacter sp. A80]|uniref:TerB family tellurite resistance protein n=1 Tax=Lutibacter sp. A80 TaxID=2918453 RepID=UPI001F060D1E|nr:TerB family tellurite resistance protein [Lutibacter sp. A80]UMB59493.1 TerB family tellurite resistance protein [Lutibacter sp. A80]